MTRADLLAQLGQFLQDKNISTWSEFLDTGVYCGGTSQARRVQRKATGQYYILKECDVGSLNVGVLINEYIFAPIYQRFLYDRAPEALLLTGNKKFSIISKVLAPNYMDLEIFLQHATTDIQGFEKVIAACLILGENDYQYRNIGVINQGPRGAPLYVAVKIDHGYSGELHYSDVPDMMNDLLVCFAFDRYEPHRRVSLNAKNFKAAIDEMVSISEVELRAIFERRVYVLRRYGISVADEYIHQHIALIMQNTRVARQLSVQLETVLATQKETPQATVQYHNGGWLGAYRCGQVQRKMDLLS